MVSCPECPEEAGFKSNILAPEPEPSTPHWAVALGAQRLLNAFLLNERKHGGLACAGGKSPAGALCCYSHSLVVFHHYSCIVAVVSGSRSCVVQVEKESIEVRCLHPSPAFLPCMLGKEQVGTALRASQQTGGGRDRRGVCVEGVGGSNLRVLGPVPPKAQSAGCAFSLPAFVQIYRDKINLTLNSPNVIYGLTLCVLQHVWPYKSR